MGKYSISVDILFVMFREEEVHPEGPGGPVGPTGIQWLDVLSGGEGGTHGNVEWS